MKALKARDPPLPAVAVSIVLVLTLKQQKNQNNNHTLGYEIDLSIYNSVYNFQYFMFTNGWRYHLLSQHAISMNKTFKSDLKFTLKDFWKIACELMRYLILLTIKVSKWGAIYLSIALIKYQRLVADIKHCLLTTREFSRSDTLPVKTLFIYFFTCTWLMKSLLVGGMDSFCHTIKWKITQVFSDAQL